uniref:Uncharacterized protein n=1 Tax=Oryza barthii TaxID=65489 RepID=A0A0D3EWM5_9ORYZ
MATMTSMNAANMATCVSLPLARRYHPSISSSQPQLPTPCATTISSMDTRKSTYGSSDSNATATPPMKEASPAAPDDFSSSMELVADAPGSKRSRSEERRPRTMASSAVSAASAPADASDAVERLSEQSCRAEEVVKEDSAESRKMEAMVLEPGGGGGAVAARKDCVLGFLQDGHTHGGAVAGAGGGDGEVSLALLWKKELKASLPMTIGTVWVSR